MTVGFMTQHLNTSRHEQPETEGHAYFRGQKTYELRRAKTAFMSEEKV